MKSIALFGGSFDPPHIGHIEIINKLKKLDFIDKVIVMPTYLNPFKNSFKADASLRLKWLKEIFKNDNKVEVSDFEVKQNKKVPTIITVKELLKKYDKIFVVIGADNLASLKKWQDFEELDNLVDFIVASRGDLKIDKKFLKLDVDIDISSTTLREKINKNALPKEVANEIYKYYKE